MGRGGRRSHEAAGFSVLNTSQSLFCLTRIYRASGSRYSVPPILRTCAASNGIRRSNFRP